MQEMIKESGYYNEEYGVLEGVPITRAEYDDGAAVIYGKVIEKLHRHKEDY
jgi:hypothetical protein